MLLIKRFIFFSYLIFKHNLLAARTDLQHCGFEQRCGRSQTNVVASKDSCCQPCECDDFCKERDTCCSDKEEFNVTEEIIKQQCLAAKFVPHGLVDSEHDDISSYYVRSRCPSTFTDNIVKNLCEKQTYDTLEKITFVSSKVENIVYRNKFCALCHGEKTTKPWTLLVNRECLSMLAEADVTSSSVEETFLANCKISFIEPSGLKIKPRICFDEDMVIGGCNRTGEWDLHVYNKTQEELCIQSSESANYYFLQAERTLVFRSVYCYVCNKKYVRSDPNTCAIGIQKNPGSLTALIRQSSLADKEGLQQDKSTTCSSDEILDTNFNICRGLYCPRFFLPKFGQCEPYLITTFSYKVLAKLVFQQPISKSDFLKQDLASLSVIISNKLGFGKCDTCHFSIRLKSDINETKVHEFYLYVIMAPTKMCDIKYLFAKLTAFEMKSFNISIVLNDSTIWFEASKETRCLSIGQVEQIYENNLKFCSVSVCTDDLSTCAKVRLGIHEYQSVLKNHANANQLLFAPVKEDINGTMLVCTDMYIVDPNSAGDKAKSNIVVAFATLIIISYRSNF